MVGFHYTESFLSQEAGNAGFSKIVLFTDEASFTRGGMLNYHNERVWAHLNPHVIRESLLRHQFSQNIWTCIGDDISCFPHPAASHFFHTSPWAGTVAHVSPFFIRLGIVCELLSSRLTNQELHHVTSQVRSGIENEVRCIYFVLKVTFKLLLRAFTSLRRLVHLLPGAAGAERLACSPPTKANRVQSPDGSLPDFRTWDSCRTMTLVGEFSRGYHPTLSSRHFTHSISFLFPYPQSASGIATTVASSRNPFYRPAIGDEYAKQRADIGQRHTGRVVFHLAITNSPPFRSLSRLQVQVGRGLSCVKYVGHYIPLRAGFLGVIPFFAVLIPPPLHPSLTSCILLIGCNDMSVPLDCQGYLEPCRLQCIGQLLLKGAWWRIQAAYMMIAVVPKLLDCIDPEELRGQ
ncbi:hypothetical protein PR048_008155 [Dryococelus australis]|uniref:Uncharacterized protein n=1 Tax=Dryococelus australis TaxID=614101 RepID=A0ABQ9HWA9_9NEOP|nr:hypothetical protein PR048_008155 [Dryococelus australis]